MCVTFGNQMDISIPMERQQTKKKETKNESAISNNVFIFTVILHNIGCFDDDNNRMIFLFEFFENYFDEQKNRFINNKEK